MDARTLRRIVIWGMPLLVIAVLVFPVTLPLVRLACSERHQDSLVSSVNEMAVASDEQRVFSSEEDLCSYVRISEGIVAAFSNGQEAVMLEWAERFPPAVFVLRGADLDRVRFPISRIWCDEWLHDEILSATVASAEDFGHDMSIRISMARIYGDFIVRSGLTANDILQTIDYRALQRLQRFARRFKEENRLDCVRVTEGLMADWIRQIESEHGFTREYLRSQDRRLERVVASGELTPEKRREIVRRGIDCLKEFCGYIPRWLDEEFPLRSP